MQQKKSNVTVSYFVTCSFLFTLFPCLQIISFVTHTFHPTTVSTERRDGVSESTAMSNGTQSPDIVDHRDTPTYWFAVLEIARERGDFEQGACEAKRELGGD